MCANEGDVEARIIVPELALSLARFACGGIACDYAGQLHVGDGPPSAVDEGDVDMTRLKRLSGGGEQVARGTVGAAEAVQDDGGLASVKWLVAEVGIGVEQKEDRVLVLWIG
ncbi:MAG TPA: hypothetical protein VFV38_01490, partial [Ktedonobacteraceae bacterium]|nr:hypothetical protein [Ktedonobacteraceae bacterium]